MLCQKIAFGIAIWLVASTTPATLWGGLIIDAGPGSTSLGFNAGNFVAGSEFSTAAPLTLRSLGWLDAEGDGLASSHAIGLWNVSGETLLRSVTVTPLSASVASAQGTAQWYLRNIVPIELAPGTYRVAGLVGDNDRFHLDGDVLGNGVTVSAGYVRSEFPDGGFVFPDEMPTLSLAIATASTDFVGTVPEPSTVFTFALLALLGCGISISGRPRPMREIRSADPRTQACR